MRRLKSFINLYKAYRKYGYCREAAVKKAWLISK